MKMRTFTQAVVFLALFAFNAHSLEIRFGDTTGNWTGWGGGVCTWAQGTTDNSRDTIGTPNLLGGSVNVNEGVLNSVTFNYINSADYGPITPGDLCIDLKADGFWDYVVDTSSRTIYSFAPGTFVLGSNSIGSNYAGTKQGYVLSGARDNYSLNGPNYQGVWTAPYAGTWDIRDDHPVRYDVNSGLASGTLNYSAAITPYFSPVVGAQTFTYAGLGLAGFRRKKD